MTGRQAIEAILPPEIILLNMDASLDKLISWEFINQKRSNILNELAKRLNFSWQKIDHRVLITSHEASTAIKTSTVFPSVLNSSLQLKPEINLVVDKNQNEITFVPTNKKAQEQVAIFNANPLNENKSSNLIKYIPPTVKNHLSLATSQVSIQDRETNYRIDRKSALLTPNLSKELSQTLESNTEEKKDISSVHRFEITQDDETLSIAFKRWSAQEGYQLIWDTDKDFTAVQAVYPLSTIEDAVLHVMKDIENSDYPLHACIYHNKVLRIIPMKKVCDRQRGLDRER